MRRALLVAALWCAGSYAMQAAAQDVIEAGAFSAEPAGAAMPRGWTPMTFKEIAAHTRYSLVTDAGVTVLKAESERSASGLIRDLAARNIDIREWPILKWRWKVANLIKGADIARKQGDDYPARIYVAFQYDPERAGAGMRMKYGIAKALYGTYPPHAGINYVWDGKAPAGAMAPNAHTDRVMMFVVESGLKRVGEWVEVERDVYADYKRAFGEEPPRVSGIAVMTDSDSTGESATAWYGDITLHRKPR